MKVLIVSFYNTEAYGVRSLHASVVRSGHDAKMLFFKMETHSYEKALKKGLNKGINSVTEKEIALFVSYVRDWSPDIVAFSLVSSHFHSFQTLSEAIRPLGKTIIVGGWGASLNPERCIAFADYLCIGEGENALCELLQRLEQGIDASDVQNFWINQNGIVFKNHVRPLNQQLQDTPIPIFSNETACYIEDNRLVFEDPYFTNDRYGTFVGIGCPFSCTYCSNVVMATQIYPKEWCHIRFHGTDRMKSEILEVKNKLHNIQIIDFYDEVFSPSIEWAAEFFAWYKKEIGIPFCCTFFPGKCSDALCQILANAGMKKVWLGVQSGSKRVRSQVFKRFYENEQVLNQARIFAKYGVVARYDFIFDNPFETFEESLESIGLMLQFPQPFSVNQFSLKFFPHTEITNMALKKGYIGENDLVDHISTWQDNYNIAKDGWNVERTFVNRTVSLISFLAKDGRLVSSDIQHMIGDFIQNRNLEEVTARLEEFLK